MAAVTTRRSASLIDRLPPVRGRYRAEVPLARWSWFRVGGPAEVLFEPADKDDLRTFLSERPPEVPVTVIGFGSNLLIRDGGVPGVVVRLGPPFAAIRAVDDEIHAGAAALSIHVARAALSAGLGGLEFLSGIPGTIGGALRMNAGAFGGETATVVRQVTAVDGIGNLHTLAAEDLGFSYRRSDVPDDWIFVAAALAGRIEPKARIAARMDEIAARRRQSQPRTLTGGSTFLNPPGEKAWRLIEQAGCRGLRRGGAMVSELHCNFLVNTGNATAADLEALGEEVRRRVKEESGIDLEWEIRRIGVARKEGT